MDRKKLFGAGFLLIALALAGCNGQDVTSTDRPNENGDSGAVEEQMAAQEEQVRPAQSQMR